MNAIKSTDEEEKIQAALQTILIQIPVSSKRALVYLFYGEHGSSPNAILQLILAYLHTPIKERVTQAVLIKNVYEMEKALGNLICSDDILPNMEVLNNALASAKASAVQHEYGYCYIDDESYR
ncbi:MAG: hypothetical protein PHC80_02850 [Eubacteriales bacterium]|nr:hypothetical protein [Eubacteriales bacterium]